MKPHQFKISCSYSKTTIKNKILITILFLLVSYVNTKFYRMNLLKGTNVLKEL